MRSTLSISELRLALFCAALAAMALLAPAVPQSAAFHGFADARSWQGIPFAADVLSNVPFALFGLSGLWACWRLPATADAAQRALAALFFAGLVLTAGVSAAYHWHPDDLGLALDRAGMSVAFAGLLGLAAASRVSPRAGWALAASVLLLGPLTITLWLHGGNILPWGVLQAGGMVLVMALGLLRPRPGAWDLRWWVVIALYALAKACESADHAIFAFDAGWLSGHSVKHLVAACAAWPVIAAVRRAAVGGPGVCGQNPAASEGLARRAAC